MTGWNTELKSNRGVISVPDVSRTEGIITDNDDKNFP